MNTRATLPLRLAKDRLADGTVLDQTAPFSVTIDCPALFLDALPSEWRFGAARGLLSGRIVFSDTLQAPNVTGEAEILDARFEPPPPWPELDDVAAQIHFERSAAVIDSLRCEIEGTPLALRARLTTSATDFHVILTPLAGGLELLEVPPSGTDISGIRLVGQGISGDEEHLREAVLRGTIASPALSLTIHSESSDSGINLPTQTTFFLRGPSGDAQPLLLQVQCRRKPPPRSSWRRLLVRPT